MRTSPVLTAAALLLLLACSAEPPLEPTESGPPALTAGDDALVAHYRLDGNALDIAGGGLHGALQGGVSAGTDRMGHPGAALLFDGDSGSVVLPGASTDGLVEGTISLWIRVADSTTPSRCGRTDLTPAADQFCNYNIFAKQVISGNPRFRAQFGSLGGGGAQIDTWGFTTDAEVPPFYPPAGAYGFEQWHLFTFVWTATESVLYFDGVAVGQGAATGTPQAGDLILGTNGTIALAGRERFEGAMDDLRIFDRALTPGEVQSLFVSSFTKDDCKNGGWVALGFRNQGQCVRFVETGKDSR